MTREEIQLALEEMKGCLKDAGSLLKYRSTLSAIYWRLFRKTLRECNCKDVLRDAYLEIYAFMKSNNQIPKEMTARLKNGALFFLRGQHYTNANLTDEVAREYLDKYPSAQGLFAALPAPEEPATPEEPTDSAEVKKTKKRKKK